jgi:hypothetical protein
LCVARRFVPSSEGKHDDRQNEKKAHAETGERKKTVRANSIDVHGHSPTLRYKCAPQPQHSTGLPLQRERGTLWRDRKEAP